MNPLRSCERITPEFPLAPLKEPDEIALQIASIPVLSPRLLTSLAADIMVIVIFVPVSPSGTGKTLSSFIHSFFASRFLAPDKNIFDSIWASITLLLKTIILLELEIDLINYTDAFDIDIYLLDFKPRKLFYFIFNSADQVV